MAHRLGELARWVDGRVLGDAERRIERVRSLDAAGPEDLSFLSSTLYLDQARKTRAGALLVGEGIGGLECDLIVVAEPALAVALILERLHPRPQARPGVHPTAAVAPDAVLEASAEIAAFVSVGARARVGAGAILHPFVSLGEGASVGAGSVLYPHVVVYPGCEIGAEVLVHAGTVIGADGFGYVWHQGQHHKVPQVGTVRIGDRVEIGANSAVDRAMVEETRIGAGTKIDNLVQVGHNVTTGDACLLCGQAGIAGSAHLGAGVVVGGQAGIAGHVTVGDGVQIAGKSALFQSAAAGEKVGGSPAVALRDWRRQQALLGRLGDLRRRVRRLEERLAEMQDKGESRE